MKAIFSETTVALIDEFDEKLFIKRRQFKNDKPVYSAKFGDGGKYRFYEHKVNNGLTLEQQFDEGIRRIK
ncbi:hypothetical protein [Mariprofundus ferrooxydans]|uniref:hypothetical protein n=1 Tax=Mariprofundus ferrooxydans TaxID=314344 RepID=UPI00036C415B|nr:hypothetical protein [Mariprofundus ferrooxydans]